MRFGCEPCGTGPPGRGRAPPSTGTKVVLAFPLHAVTAKMNERKTFLFQTTNKVPKLCLHSPLGRIGYSSNMTVYPRLLRSSVLCVVHTL